MIFRYWKKIINKYKLLSIPLKSTLWFLIIAVFQKGVSFFSTAIFTRIMSVDEYGKFTIYTSWLEVISIIATLNLYYGSFNKGLLKYKNNQSEYTTSVFGLILFLTTLSFGLYYIFSDLINTYSGLTFELTFLLFIDIVFISAYKLWTTKERFIYSYKKSIFVGMSTAFLLPLFGLVFVINSNDKGDGRIISQVFVHFMLYSAIVIALLKNRKKIYNREYWKYSLLFNLPLLPHYLTSVILNQSDRIMINNIIGIKEAGIYTFAYTIGIMAIFIIENLSNTTIPWLYRKLENRSNDDINDFTKATFFLVMILSALVVILSPEIIVLLGTDEYSMAVFIVPPIAISLFYRYIYLIYSSVEFYFEAKYFISVASILNALLNIILNIIFIPKYGFIAAGYTTLFCFYAYSFTHTVFANYLLQKNGYQIILSNKFISILMTLQILLIIAFLMVYQNSLIRIVILFVIGSVLILSRRYFKENLLKMRN